MNCSERICKYLEKNSGPLNDRQKQLLYHGTETMLSDISCWLHVLFISMLMRKQNETIIFIIVLSLLRTYTGGWHAETKLKCRLSYVFTYLFCITLVSVSFPEYVYLLVLILCGAYTMAYVPVEHYLNPLTENEIRKNRIRGRLSVISIISVSVIGLATGNRIYEINTAVLFVNSILMFILRNSSEWRYYENPMRSC